MENIYDNYRMVEEVKERAVERASGRTEYESYDRVAKVERRNGKEDYVAGLVIIMVNL